MISDSQYIADYYEKKYGCRPAYAAYGAAVSGGCDSALLKKYGLVPGKYFLFVGRMEPENHPDLVVEAYARLSEKENLYPLVMAGWAPYAKAYEKDVRAKASPRVRFLGGVYGADYGALLAHCRSLVHAASVGGTHPVLVEAMGAGRPIAASDIPENRETLGDAAVFFGLKSSELAAAWRQLLDDPAAAEELGKKARGRACEKFDWEKVTDRYEEIFHFFSF